MQGEFPGNNMEVAVLKELLGREPIEVDMEEIYRHLTGKVILVTGGGGSIGGELCWQIAAHAPRQLILFDIYENGAYDTAEALLAAYPGRLNLVVRIGSVQDRRRLDQIFSRYRPQLVFHAAAHKHVPLMEENPNEAIKNNVIGTYQTAYAALRYGAERFVLISTDKAVNPTSIMGASKRLCEMVVQSMDAVSRAGRADLLPLLDDRRDWNNENRQRLAQDAHLTICAEDDSARQRTRFVAVRFGNVLGSNGSVIPLFQRQIARGGPVTVTHPDVVRYFMTVSEAVSLVLQAGVYAWGGEIFVLDMGEPVKIDTLARSLIQRAGLKPDVDIPLVYTGLRPGEKLYEEKLMAEEGMKKTKNKLIHIGKPIPFDIGQFFLQLEELAKASYDNSDHIVELVAKLVPTYHPGGGRPA